MSDSARDRSMIELASAVRDRESLLGTVIGSAIGAAIAASLFYVFGSVGTVFVILLVLPSFAVAYGARLLGRPVRLWLRLIPGGVAASVHAVGSVLLFPSAVAIGLTPASFVIGSYFARAKLTNEEEKALFRQDLRDGS